MAFYTWMIIMSFVSFCLDISSGTLDATAVLMECEKDSSKNDLKRKSPPYHTIDNCIRKIRITLNISNVGKTPADLDYTFLSQIMDPDNGSNLYLLNPVVLRLRQDQVILAYPFYYVSAVNAKATEIVVNYQNRKNFTGCDDTSQINPTCGLKHERGRAVPFSEGFCCFCPEAPAKVKQARGGQDCSLDVGDPTDVEKQKIKASAHCLHFSDIWYSVSFLADPFILHETFMQVYNQKHLKNSSSVWVALTHDEDFELGPVNTYQYDDNKTILISYLTGSPNEKAVTVPISDRRLLTPQPMPSVELSQLPEPVKNGASDYLLLPYAMIDPDGNTCDVAGVSYEAFAKQPDRCNVVKDTCIKNQPLDFWEMDNGKRKAGARGSYLLENFGIPYKDPIIVDPETKEHWLAMEYHEPHKTVLIVEISADEITVMGVGKHAQISKLMSSTTTKTISIFVSILNAGLMPAKFNIRAVKCAFGVPDSSNETIFIPPQMTGDVVVITKPGSTSLDEKFECTVQVSSDSYGVVAKREIIVNPLARCICNFHCECVCLSGSLECKPMSEEDYHAAGFRGSLPILTAKPPYKLWFIHHPYLAMLAFQLFFLLFGLIKAIFGLSGFKKIGYYGMDKFLYQPKKIERYIQPELKNVNVVYDAEGYPIHPDTRERVAVVRDELMVCFNLFFCFFWPCLKCRECLSRMSERQKKRSDKKSDLFDTEDSSPDSKSHSKADRKNKDIKGSSKSKSKKSGDAPSKKKARPATESRPAAEKELNFLSPELMSVADRQMPNLFQGHRKSISDSDLEKQYIANPVADPLNKELERWKKGKGKVQAVRK